MTDLPGIVVTGASGRMGRMLIETVMQSDTARIAGAVERPGHDWVGKDLGACLGGADIGVIVSDDPAQAFAGAQAVLDFTAPAAAVAHAELSAQARAVHVIGVTGLEEAHLAAFEAAANGPLKGILAVTREPLVSIDLNHAPASATVALDQIKVMDGRMVRVLAWYDNEWGFSNRMADVAALMGQLG